MSATILPGIITGEDVQAVFRYAKERKFALPAVNVTGSNTINGVLETAALLRAPAILQFSNGGGLISMRVKDFLTNSKKLLSPVLSLARNTYISWRRSTGLL